MITVYGLNVKKFQKGHQLKLSDLFQEFAQMKQKPDFICLQETKAKASDFPSSVCLSGYHIAENFDSGAPFDTGVAILSKHRISKRDDHLCDHPDCQSRFVEATIGELRIASAYAHPNDKTRTQRSDSREQFNRCVASYMQRNSGTPCVLVMDANVALSRADVANKIDFENKNERALRRWRGRWANAENGRYRNPFANQLSRAALGDSAWLDSYRKKHGEEKRRATVWFSQKQFAAINGEDEGFGIDFQFVSPMFRNGVIETDVIKALSWAERPSDHALTMGKYDYTIVKESHS